jgi:hypothetical protein
MSNPSPGAANAGFSLQFPTRYPYSSGVGNSSNIVLRSSTQDREISILIVIFTNLRTLLFPEKFRFPEMTSMDLNVAKMLQ